MVMNYSYSFIQKKEKEKKIKSILNKIENKKKEIESIVRTHPGNSFEKVYILLAINKVIDDLAIFYSFGSIDVNKNGNILEVAITNTKLTNTDIKTILGRESKNVYVYSLIQALKELDDFKIESNSEGTGIVFRIMKALPN